MSEQKKLQTDHVRILLDYDPETGELTWRERAAEWFSEGKRPQAVMAKIWNKQFAGKRAFTALNGQGYLHGSFLQRNYYAHQVAWTHFHGAFPESPIDHIDQVKTNNRINNLRVVEPWENQRNLRLLKNNKSGHPGVGWVERDQRWYARVTVNDKPIHLGYFEQKEDAIAARMAANEKYMFHENHGKDHSKLIP